MPEDESRISLDTLKKVLDAAAQMQDAPNGSTRRLAPARRIAVVTTSETGRGLLNNILAAASSEFQSEGYSLSYLTLNPQNSTPISADEVEGALLVGISMRMLPMLRSLLAQNKPTICVESDVAPAIGAQEVSNDAENGSYKATLHMISMGHNQIALLNGPMESALARAVWQGYRRAMAEHNVMLPVRLLVEGDFGVASGHAALQMLLSYRPLPAALVCATDEMAFGALQAISANNLRVPDDIAVIGMGDIEAAAFTNPPLTTIRVDAERIGQTAASALMQRIAGTTSGGERTLIANSLIMRDSCGYGRSRSRPATLLQPPPRATATAQRAKVIPMNVKATRKLDTLDQA